MGEEKLQQCDYVQFQQIMNCRKKIQIRVIFAVCYQEKNQTKTKTRFIAQLKAFAPIYQRPQV